MHEYSIVMSLADAVKAELDAHRATSVRRVVIRIGELSGVDPQLLITAYSTFKTATVLEPSELELKHVAAVWTCSQCDRVMTRGQVLQCPKCRIPATMRSGDEIILERVEMEVSDV